MVRRHLSPQPPPPIPPLSPLSQFKLGGNRNHYIHFDFILGGYTHTAEALDTVHYNVLKPAVDNPVTDTETVQVPLRFDSFNIHHSKIP